MHYRAKEGRSLRNGRVPSDRDGMTVAGNVVNGEDIERMVGATLEFGGRSDQNTYTEQCARGPDTRNMLWLIHSK